MQAVIKQIVDEFKDSLSSQVSPEYWKKAGEAFRAFWNKKILNKNVADFGGKEIDDLDPIIRILDINGKRRYSFEHEKEREELRKRLLESGSQYGIEYEFEESGKHLVIVNVEGAARTLIPQKRWYEIFYDLKSDEELSEKLDQILHEADLKIKAPLIDELEEINKKHKNFLTKPAAIAINVILCTYDSEKFLQAASLYHRKRIIESLQLGEINEEESYGNQIIKTNNLLLGFNQKLGTSFSALELSYLFYYVRMREFWKTGGYIGKTVYFVLITGSEKYKDEPMKRYHFKQGIPGSKQLVKAENVGKFVYYEKGRFYAKGDIGTISSYEENDVTYYYAEVKNFEHVGPIDFNEVRNDLSFSGVGAAGIRRISQADYSIIIGRRTVSPELSFLHSSLELTPDELIFNPLLFEDENLLKSNIHAALASGKHLMLVGPPGTGKTEIALSLCRIAEKKDYIHGYIPTTATSDWTTFDTIGGYVPNKEGESLEFMPGQFLRCFKENGNPINKWLIIDEINRSDIDKAFGQLFTVLSGQSVELPFSQETGCVEIIPHKSFKKPLVDQNEYVVPNSWRLIATLNTYDKASLYQMSYAFMRRFAFIYVNVPSSDFIENNWIKYLEYWGISYSDDLKPCLDGLREIWQSLNVDNKRPIGPAIIKDMLEFIVSYAKNIPSIDESTKRQILTNAVSSFVVPQFEGLEQDSLNELKKRLVVHCESEKINSLFEEMFEE